MFSGENHVKGWTAIRRHWVRFHVQKQFQFFRNLGQQVRLLFEHGCAAQQQQQRQRVVVKRSTFLDVVKRLVQVVVDVVVVVVVDVQKRRRQRHEQLVLPESEFTERGFESRLGQQVQSGHEPMDAAIHVNKKNQVQIKKNIFRAFWCILTILHFIYFFTHWRIISVSSFVKHLCFDFSPYHCTRSKKKCD